MPKVGDKISGKESMLARARKVYAEYKSCMTEYHLALNIADLTRVDPLIRGMLLQGKIMRGEAPIWTDKSRGDECAVRMCCDLLTAATTADVLRSNDRKVGDHPLRTYISRDGITWTKLPHSAVLTEVINGRVELAVKWFPEMVEMVPASALPPSKFA